jgi:hypothetical protein
MDENGVDIAAVFDDDTVSAAVATQQDDGAFTIEHYAMVWIAIIMTYYWGQQVKCATFFSWSSAFVLSTLD